MKHAQKKMLWQQLIDQYMLIETDLQRRIAAIADDLCRDCNGRCCREEICRESIHSPFLALLVARQNLRYDHQSGWGSRKGCRLSYGRPMVCYDFFCDTVKARPEFIASGIERLIKDFMRVGERCRGTCHLICVDDLQRLSTAKLNTMNHRLELLQRALIRPVSPPNP